MATFTADCNFTETDTMGLTALATFFARLGKVHTLNIDVGDTVSDTLDLKTKNRRCNALLIHGPATLDGIVGMQVSFDGSSWVPLQSAGSDITVSAVKAVVITNLPPCFIRFVSDTAEDPARPIYVLAISTTGV